MVIFKFSKWSFNIKNSNIQTYLILNIDYILFKNSSNNETFKIVIEDFNQFSGSSPLGRRFP